MRSSGIIIAAAAAVANAHYDEPVVYGTPSAQTSSHVGFTTVYTQPGNVTQPTHPTPTEYTTSTVYTTKTYTITQCPPTVVNCPVGHVTTETFAVSTTVCPVTEVHTEPSKPHEPAYPNPTEPSKPHEPVPNHPGGDVITKTQTYAYPHPTNPGQSVTKTIVYTVPNDHGHNATAVNPPPHTYYPVPTGGAHVHPNGTAPGYPGNQGSHGGNTPQGGESGNDDGTDNGNGNGSGNSNGNGNSGSEGSNGGSSGNSGSESEDHSPSSTDAPEAVTAGAGMNTVTGLLAIVGFAVAYLI